MNNALWNIITATGLFTLPLIFHLAGIWLTSTGSDGWVMNLVLGAMYIALPLFWFGAMSWCGISPGHAFSTAMSAVRMAAGRK